MRQSGVMTGKKDVDVYRDLGVYQGDDESRDLKIQKEETR